MNAPNNFNGYQNFNGPMGTYPQIPPNPNNYNGMGCYGAPPIPPNGLSMAASQVTSQTNVMNPMMMSNVSAFPPAMNGYAAGMTASMAGYGPNMINTGMAPYPAMGMGYNPGVVANSNSRVLITQTNSNSRVLIGGGANSNSRVIIAPPIYNKAVVQQRPSQSRVEYIPYQTKEIVYDTIEKREVIPIQKTITEYEQLKHIETIPVEKSVTDYYAIEYLTEFMPNVTSERVVDYVQQEVINETVNYRPVDTQRVIPNQQLRASGVNIPTPTIMTQANNMYYGQPPVSPLVQSVQPIQPNAMVTSVHSNYYGQNPIQTGLYNGITAAPMF